MKEVTYRFENVTVKLIDHSSHQDRQKNLTKALNDFYQQARKDYEKSIKTKN